MPDRLIIIRPPAKRLIVTRPGSQGPRGAGWSPALSVVADGERRVLQVVGWLGGIGTAPATGQYLGGAGLVDDITDATDVRGAVGEAGSVVRWEDVLDKPSTFPPASHTHTAAEVGADPVGSAAAAQAAAALDATAKANAAQAAAATDATAKANAAQAAAATALAAHVSAPDPHAGYQMESEKGQANGYASLGSDGLVPTSQLPPASGAVNYQARFTAGTFTWTNPSPTVRRLVRGRLVSGGGGGGSGRKGAPGSIRCGGGGGAPGGQLIFEAWSDELPSSVTVTVGPGGAGGASVTANNTNGNAGVAGGVTTFIAGRYQASPGGQPGSGGTNSGGAAGAGTAGVFLLYANSASPAGGAASATGGAGNHGTNPFGLHIIPSGGAGGGISTTEVRGNGGNGGRNTYGSLGESFGTAPSGGVFDGAPGSTGSAIRGGVGGFGGSGGAGHPTGNGGSGSSGIFGGGGGGGGAATDNLGNSGAGGNGGDGFAEIWVL